MSVADRIAKKIEEANIRFTEKAAPKTSKFVALPANKVSVKLIDSEKYSVVVSIPKANSAGWIAFYKSLGYKASKDPTKMTKLFGPLKMRPAAWLNSCKKGLVEALDKWNASEGKSSSGKTSGKAAVKLTAAQMLKMAADGKSVPATKDNMAVLLKALKSAKSKAK